MDVSAEIAIDGASVAKRTTLTAIGYYAQQLRDDAKKYFVNESQRNNRIKNIFKIDSSANITNLDAHAKVLTIEFSHPVSNGISGDSIWFTPIDRIEIDTLYLSDEERLYAFDLEYARMESYTVKLKIPAGYAIKRIPAPKMLLLPDRSGRFVFNATNNEGNVTVICQLVLSKSIYDIDEYGHIKELLRGAIAKLNEPIVLKKWE
jgi:hypothetical protein